MNLVSICFNTVSSSSEFLLMQIEKRIFIHTCSGWYDHDDYKDGEWGRLSGSSVQNPRGQTVGLNCRTLAKAKTQLAKASPKPNKSQVDRHRRESFAKVSNWHVFYTCKIASNKIRRAPRKQILWIFTARKVRVWLRKHRKAPRVWWNDKALLNIGRPLISQILSEFGVDDQVWTIFLYLGLNLDSCPHVCLRIAARKTDTF